MAERKKKTNAINFDWNKNKTTVIIIALIIAAIIAIICICSPTWFGRNNDAGLNTDNTNNQVIAISDKGEKMLAGGTYTIPETMTIIAEAPTKSSYAPDSEFTITATVSNEYINGIFDFTYDFMDGSGDWANDKEASECIEITPISTDSAKVKLLASFGAPIEIKAQLIGSDSFATCRVDYLQRVESYKLGMMGSDVSDDLGLDLNVTFGTGTVSGGDFELQSGMISILDDFQDKVKSYLKFDIDFKTFVLNKSQVNTSTYSDDYWAFEVDAPGYAAFIVDFDNYDQQHKEAIYYAWYTAFYTTYSQNIYGYYNTLLDIDVHYSYHGVYISGIAETYYVGGFISGDYYGSDISPDVDLNGGVIF